LSAHETKTTVTHYWRNAVICERDPTSVDHFDRGALLPFLSGTR
jgi:hypothetical protein